MHLSPKYYTVKITCKHDFEGQINAFVHLSFLKEVDILNKITTPTPPPTHTQTQKYPIHTP